MFEPYSYQPINNGDLSELMNSFMITIDKTRYKETCDVFSSMGLNPPTLMPGVVGGVRATCLSHKKVIDTAIENRLPWCLDFEDDAYPCNDIYLRLKGLDLPEADIYLLGYSWTNHRNVPVVDGWFEVKRGDKCTGAHAMLIRESAYPFLREAWASQKFPADQIWDARFPRYPHIRVVTLKNPLFIQYNKITSVLNKHKGYIFFGDHTQPPSGFPTIQQALEKKMSPLRGMKTDYPIVTMTSYPKRIGNVARSIIYMMTEQTLPPEEFHLWLATEEFPKREFNLPRDLVDLCGCPNVFLHWVPRNTYCHKRHEIYKHAKDNACVFQVDDDVKYNDTLIQTTMAAHRKYPNCIINYEGYSEHVYVGRKKKYCNREKYSEPSVMIRWCGQSMIPARLYPKQALTDENVAIRDKTSPMCDEAWLTPWIVLNDIPVYNQYFGWGEDIDPLIKHEEGFCSVVHQHASNGLENGDVWLSNVLEAYPEMMKKYEEMFNYGK